MSYFVFFCWLFICKPLWINCLSWRRESYFVCYRLLVIMWFLFGEVFCPLGAWNGLRYFIVAPPEPFI